MSSYISTTEQKDLSQTIGEATTVMGPSSVMTSPGSFVVQEDAKVGDITYNQFPDAVKESLKDMISTVEKTVYQTSQAGQKATEAVSAALRTQQAGSASVFVDLLKIGGIIVGVWFVGRALLRG